MFSPDQFMHILPPSFWHITTARYYFHETTFLTRNQKCYGKVCQRYIWAQVNQTYLCTGLGHAMSLVGCWGEYRDVGASGAWALHMKNTVYCKVLVKTQDGLLQTIAHELRSVRPKVVPLLTTKCLYLVGIEGHMWGMGVAGYTWQNIILIYRLMTCYADLQ